MKSEKKLRKKAIKAKKRQNRLIRDMKEIVERSQMGFVGHKVEARQSFTEKIQERTPQKQPICSRFERDFQYYLNHCVFSSSS